MKPINLFCLVLVAILIAFGCERKLTRSPKPAHDVAITSSFVSSSDIEELKVDVNELDKSLLQAAADGPGYQVQLSETCHPENEVQLTTCALPQTAVEPDTAATSKVLDNLEEPKLPCIPKI